MSLDQHCSYDVQSIFVTDGSSDYKYALNAANALEIPESKLYSIKTNISRAIVEKCIIDESIPGNTNKKWITEANKLDNTVILYIIKR